MSMRRAPESIETMSAFRGVRSSREYQFDLKEERHSYGHQWALFPCWQLDRNHVPDLYVAARNYNRHDASLADEGTVCVTAEY
jgi:hypothetical protein